MGYSQEDVRKYLKLKSTGMISRWERGATMPSGKNLLVEVSTRSGNVLDMRNVDNGAQGALFGLVATGTNAANTKVYFNDDNDNNVQVLER